MFVIRKYEELKPYVLASSKNQINLLLVEGRGGTGKTRIVHDTLVKSDVPFTLLSGHVTGLSLYKELFNSRDRLIVLDDIDALLRDKIKVALLKQLCDTNPNKEIQYHSTSRLADDVPQSFITTSKVILLCNTLSKASMDVQAFLTRGIHCVFDPPVVEVLNYLRGFAKDTEVLSYLDSVRAGISVLDLRKYVLALELKKAGIDWRHYLELELGVNKVIASASEISVLPTSYKEKVELFKQKTGLSQTTFDRTVKKLSSRPEISDNQ